MTSLRPCCQQRRHTFPIPGLCQVSDPPCPFPSNVIILQIRRSREYTLCCLSCPWGVWGDPNPRKFLSNGEEENSEAKYVCLSSYIALCQTASSPCSPLDEGGCCCCQTPPPPGSEAGLVPPDPGWRRRAGFAVALISDGAICLLFHWFSQSTNVH